MWTAPVGKRFFDVVSGLVGCCPMSGLLARRAWPLAYFGTYFGNTLLNPEFAKPRPGNRWRRPAGSAPNGAAQIRGWGLRRRPDLAARADWQLARRHLTAARELAYATAHKEHIDQLLGSIP